MNKDGEPPNGDKRLGIQQFNLNSLKATLNVTGDPTARDINEVFDELKTKKEADFKDGFYILTDPDTSTGHLVVYTHLARTEFILSRTIINGTHCSERLSGRHRFEGGEICVMIERPLGSKIPNCYVFLNQGLVASRTNPFDEMAQFADMVNRQIVLGRGETGAHLDEPITAEMSPYPFVLKMLRDYTASIVDTRRTEIMYEEMRRKKPRWKVIKANY